MGQSRRAAPLTAPSGLLDVPGRSASASSPHGIRLAVRTLASAGVVAYPTEAVYGLGCDPNNRCAVRRLLAIKRRPAGKGLILIASDYAQLAPFIQHLDGTRMAEILATWPGPSTWLLPARATTPGWLTGDHRTLAVRVTAHPLAAALCRAWGGALVSTSANVSNRRPARTALTLRKRLRRRPDLILVGACGTLARPTAIRDGATGRVVRA